MLAAEVASSLDTGQEPDGATAASFVSEVMRRVEALGPTGTNVGEGVGLGDSGAGAAHGAGLSSALWKRLRDVGAAAERADGLQNGEDTGSRADAPSWEGRDLHASEEEHAAAEAAHNAR